MSVDQIRLEMFDFNEINVNLITINTCSMNLKNIGRISNYVSGEHVYLKCSSSLQSHSCFFCFSLFEIIVKY